MRRFAGTGRWIPILTLLVVAAGGVHTELERSIPPDGANLSEGPSEIRLVFSGPVEASLSAIDLVTEDGARLSLTPTAVGDRVLVAPVPGLGNGGYTIAWNTVSSDGHRITGRFAFRVALDATAAAAPTAAPPAEPPRPPAETPFAPALLRGGAFAALLGLAGVLAHGAWNRGGSGTPLARSLAVATPFLLAVHFVSWVASVAPRGVVDGVVAAALGTGIGRLEVARLALATMAAVALLTLHAPRVAAALALLAVLAGAAIGHASEFAPLWSIPLKAAHLLAVALWLGGLLILAFGALPTDRYRATAFRVSGLALWSVVIVIVTGVAQSWLIAGSPAGLMGTRYGAILAVKSLGVVGLVAFGAWHRRRVLPTLEEPAGPDTLTRSVRLETALFVAVLLVAGLLASTSPP